MTDHILSNSLQRARGVIGRYPGQDERYILEYDSIEERGVHMLFVRHPLKVSFLADGDLVHETVLSPWSGTASARADTIIEERPDEV